jgi:L-lactate dehydrogenase complex protein LldG
MTEGHGGDPRSRILARIGDALEGRSIVEHPGELAPEEGPPAPPRDADVAVRITTFSERFREAGGEVVRLQGPSEAARWLSGFAREFAATATSDKVPDSFRPDLPAAASEEAPLGVSWALAGAAQTGSLLLGSGEGRRLQLLPPVHLVWVRADSVHATLAEALDSVRTRLPAALGLHSGPSKSADIGGIVVTGVHGPGRVVAAIIE